MMAVQKVWAAVVAGGLGNQEIAGRAIAGHMMQIAGLVGRRMIGD